MKAKVNPVESGGIRLRMIEESDLSMTLAWRNRDDARIWFKSSTLLSMEQHHSWFCNYLERNNDFLFIVESDGRPVGQVSVYDIDWLKRSGEVGRFLVSPEAAGRGKMKAACSLLRDLCRESLELRYIYLEVLAGNERAYNLYSSIGFVEEGRDECVVRMGIQFENKGCLG